MLWRRDDPAPERVLVTGATGLLGTAVVQDLVSNGYAVHAIDQRRPAPGSLPDELVRFIEVDLHDIGQIADAMRGCVAVIHLGAIPSPYAHPDNVVFRNNTLATFSVFQAASLLGVKRLAFASSESIYGTAWTPDRVFIQWAPVDESYPLDIRDAYGLTKEVDEATARMFCRRDGMTIAGLRFAWIVSREQQLARVHERGDAPSVDDATLLFSYVDLRDAARACRIAIEVADVQPFGFRAFNIVAADTLITIPTEEAIRRYSPETEIRSPIPGNMGAFDLSEAKRMLGWQPQHSWRDVR